MSRIKVVCCVTSKLRSASLYPASCAIELWLLIFSENFCKEGFQQTLSWKSYATIMAATINPLQMPAIEPPPGQTSNLVNPTNSLHTVVIVTLVICLIPPTILIPLRMYVRTRILKAFELVDGTQSLPDEYRMKAL